MNVRLKPPTEKGKTLVPEQKQLKDLKSPNGFRFYDNNGHSEEEVIRKGEVYIVIDYPGAVAGRIRCVCLGTGKVLERDGETWVIPHDVDHLVSPSKKVEETQPAAEE